jgi:probable HAF family extracellular repeat protein
MQDLGVLPSLPGSSFGAAISADGLAVAGTGYSNLFGNGHAFRWTSGSGMQDLSPAPGLTSVGNAISGNGSVVAGYATFVVGGSNHAFRWTSATGMQNLETLPGNQSQANAMSPDGSIIVGERGVSTASGRAFRWTVSGGMQDLGILPGMDTSNAFALSGDGTLIGGTVHSNALGDGAFLWTSAVGMVDPNVYLPTLGVDLTGWNLRSVSAISADGSTIAGGGSFNGQTRGWIIRGIPTPGTVALLGLFGGLTVPRRRRSFST